MTEACIVHLAQKDGTLPAMVAAGPPPGESGVSVLQASFRGGAHLNATPKRHLICFQTKSGVRFHCRIGGQKLLHSARAGTLAVVPAGIDCTANADQSVDALFVAVDPHQLSLAAAEGESLGARVIERLSGKDHILFDLARSLAAESARGYPEGTLFWNDVASRFVHGIIARHTVKTKNAKRGTLDDHALSRIREYVLDNLSEPVEVAALADIAGRSPFHFSRVFLRSVGVTPHRYVVHLRLQRATELLRHGNLNLAEIAARTGFADQSHLSRWIRRVRGVTPTQLSG